MAREQWVNLTVNNKWIGEGITDRKQLSEIAPMMVRFAQPGRHVFYLKKEAKANNAAYSATEKPRRLGFRPGTFNRRRFRTHQDGTFLLRQRVTLAGGDEYTFTVENVNGKTKSREVHTRRKLYYQIIRMNGAPALSAALITQFESQFWNTANRLYVKMVQITPGRTIPAMVNLDDTVPADYNLVCQQARAQRDNSKKPYSVVTLLVRKNCIRGWEDRPIPTTFTGPTHSFQTLDPLYDVADPTVDWYGRIRWVPNGGGAPHNIPKASCTRAGQGQFGVQINTAGLPRNVPGRLEIRLRIIEIEGMGVSFSGNNLTLVATQDAVGTAVPPATVVAITNHEVGHKIGMVPGPQGTRALDKQSSHYTGRGHSGPHCHTGTALAANFMTVVPAPTATCVMFGDISSNTANFCGACLGSLRKLDLRSRTNRGLRTQF